MPQALLYLEFKIKFKLIPLSNNLRIKVNPLKKLYSKSSKSTLTSIFPKKHKDY